MRLESCRYGGLIFIKHFTPLYGMIDDKEDFIRKEHLNEIHSLCGFAFRFKNECKS